VHAAIRTDKKSRPKKMLVFLQSIDEMPDLDGAGRPGQPHDDAAHRRLRDRG
jgi:hypothetical protein